MVRNQIQFSKTSHLYRGVFKTSLFLGFSNGLIFSSYYSMHHSPFWISGILSGLLFHPFENYKILKQTNSLYKSSFLMKGIHFSLIREIMGIPLYFETYDSLKYYCHPYIAGGMAGIHSWIWTYPFSTLKTRYILNQPLFSFSLYQGFSFCVIRSFLMNGLCFTLRDYLEKNIFTINK